MKTVHIKKLLKKYKYSRVRPLDRYICYYVRTLCVYGIIRNRDYGVFVDLLHFFNDLDFKLERSLLNLNLEVDNEKKN